MKTEKLQITDSAGISLSGILSEIDGADMMWSISCLEAVGNLGPDHSMLELESKIDRSGTGLPIDWESLVELASKCEQVINLRLIGLNKASSGDSEVSVSVELVDSAVWEVKSNNSMLIGRMRRRFA